MHPLDPAAIPPSDQDRYARATFPYRAFLEAMERPYLHDLQYLRSRDVHREVFYDTLNACPPS